MQPNNPSNSNPLIYRILDAIGVAHLVAPINHLHAQSEVTDLVTDLDAKASKGLEVPAGNFPMYNESGDIEDSGKKASDFASASSVSDKISKVTSPTAGNFPKLKADGTIEDSGKSASDFASASDVIPKVSNPTVGDFPKFKSDGTLEDSGKKASDFAASSHTHLPVDIVGVIPQYVDYDGSVILDLDELVNSEVGMKRLYVYNDSPDPTNLNSLFESASGLPIHINMNGEAVIESQHYAIVTVFKIDKNMNPDDSHDHDLCYFITLDGIFDDGNVQA